MRGHESILSPSPMWNIAQAKKKHNNIGDAGYEVDCSTIKDCHHFLLEAFNLWSSQSTLDFRKSTSFHRKKQFRLGTFFHPQMVTPRNFSNSIGLLTTPLTSFGRIYHEDLEDEPRGCRHPFQDVLMESSNGPIAPYYDLGRGYRPWNGNPRKPVENTGNFLETDLRFRRNHRFLGQTVGF